MKLIVYTQNLMQYCENTARNFRIVLFGRKERQFRGLSDFVEGSKEVSVVRAGEDMRIPANQLLVGDLCQVRTFNLPKYCLFNKKKSSKMGYFVYFVFNSTQRPLSESHPVK